MIHIIFDIFKIILIAFIYGASLIIIRPIVNNYFPGLRKEDTNIKILIDIS